MKYDCTIVFHKITSLHSYFLANEHKLVGHLCPGDVRRNRITQRYITEQDIRLVLLVRYEHDPLNCRVRTFCKIHCPVSPLPIKGEFEAPSINAVVSFLKTNGWHETDALPSNLLE